MKNAIAERIYDFLKKFHPFTFIDEDNLIEIAKNISVLYLDKNEYLFKINDNMK